MSINMDDYKWLTAPEDQGQIVIVSYAGDWENTRIIKHIFDSSDRTESFEVADADDLEGPYEPWNGAGNLRDLHWEVDE